MIKLSYVKHSYIKIIYSLTIIFTKNHSMVLHIISTLKVTFSFMNLGLVIPYSTQNVNTKCVLLIFSWQTISNFLSLINLF